MNDFVSTLISNPIRRSTRRAYVMLGSLDRTECEARKWETRNSRCMASPPQRTVSFIFCEPSLCILTFHSGLLAIKKSPRIWRHFRTFIYYEALSTCAARRFFFPPLIFMLETLKCLNLFFSICYFSVVIIHLIVSRVSTICNFFFRWP